jgi:hypothetical protein
MSLDILSFGKGETKKAPKGYKTLPGAFILESSGNSFSYAPPEE